jgi:hypothetical protein
VDDLKWLHANHSHEGDDKGFSLPAERNAKLPHVRPPPEHVLVPPPFPTLVLRSITIRLLTWIWLLRGVPKVGSLMGRSTSSLLLASTMLFRPLSTVPTSSATNSANSWKPGGAQQRGPGSSRKGGNGMVL